MHRQSETGETIAQARKRADDRVWPDVLTMLQAGATLFRPTRMKDYYTDDGHHMGKISISTARVKKLEAEGILRRAGVDRYSLKK